MESLGARADAFNRVIDSTGAAPKELESKNPEDYRLLSDSVGDVLSGYTLAETGTVALIGNGTVIASDDARVPAGSDARTVLGDQVCDAIDKSLQDGQLQTIPYNGVFDEPGGVLDYATGHVEYVNAGHNPPLFWQKGTGWSWLEEKSGLPLGLIDGGVYDMHSLDWRSGDKILLYTDGVTEAMNESGELYGEERLEAAANAHLLPKWMRIDSRSGCAFTPEVDAHLLPKSMRIRAAKPRRSHVIMGAATVALRECEERIRTWNCSITRKSTWRASERAWRSAWCFCAKTENSR